MLVFATFVFLKFVSQAKPTFLIFLSCPESKVVIPKFSEIVQIEYSVGFAPNPAIGCSAECVDKLRRHRDPRKNRELPLQVKRGEQTFAKHNTVLVK